MMRSPYTYTSPNPRALTRTVTLPFHPPRIGPEPLVLTRMRFGSMASMTDSMSSTEMRGQVMRRGFAAFDSIRSPGRGVEPPSAEEIAAKVADEDIHF